MEKLKTQANHIENAIRYLNKQRGRRNVTAELIYNTAKHFNLEFITVKRIVQSKNI